MMKKKIILTNADDSKRIGVVVYSIQELKSKGDKFCIVYLGHIRVYLDISPLCHK
jgi:hypothetical protein